MRINEGGNATITVGNKVVKAQKIPLKEIGRSNFVKDTKEMLKELNKLFQKKYGEPLWDESLLKGSDLFNGSTSFIMDDNISDEEILPFKDSAGDIDITVPENLKEQLWEFLNIVRKKYARLTPKYTYLGNNKESLSSINDQINAIFKYDYGNGEVFVQIDFEFVPFETKEIKSVDDFGNNTTIKILAPNEWAKFGHSSSLDDAKLRVEVKKFWTGYLNENGNIIDEKGIVKAQNGHYAILKEENGDVIYLPEDMKNPDLSLKLGVKAVMHKYLLRSIARAVSQKPNVILVTAKADCDNWKKKIKKKQDDSMLKFSVSKGARLAYKPLICADGNPVIEDGKIVFKEIPTKESEYTTDLTEMFELFFNRKPTKNELEMMWSFKGLVELMKKYLTKEQIEIAVNRFVQLLWENKAGKNIAQQLERDYPLVDYQIKIAGLTYLEQELHTKVDADDMIYEYYKNYTTSNGSLLSLALQRIGV